MAVPSLNKAQTRDAERRLAGGRTMPSASFLDDLVERFRHRWETDRQYRAAASGVLGVVVLVVLCSCAGIVSTVTNNVLASGGFLSSGTPNSVGTQSTSNTVLQSAVFPTETIPAWTPGVIPGAPPVPNSQTPVPIPTAVPSPTDLPTATHPRVAVDVFVPQRLRRPHGG